MYRSPNEQCIFAEQISQRLGNQPKVLDEFPIISCKTQKPTESTHIRWYRPTRDSLNLGRVCGDATLTDDMVEVGYLPPSKPALRELKAPLIGC